MIFTFPNTATGQNETMEAPHFRFGPDGAFLLEDDAHRLIGRIPSVLPVTITYADGEGIPTPPKVATEPVPAPVQPVTPVLAVPVSTPDDETTIIPKPVQTDETVVMPPVPADAPKPTAAMMRHGLDKVSAQILNGGRSDVVPPFLRDSRLSAILTASRAGSTALASFRVRPASGTWATQISSSRTPMPVG